MMKLKLACRYVFWFSGLNYDALDCDLIHLMNDFGTKILLTVNDWMMKNFGYGLPLIDGMNWNCHGYELHLIYGQTRNRKGY